MRLGGLFAIVAVLALSAAAATAAPLGELQARELRTLDPAIAFGAASAISVQAPADGPAMGHDLRLLAERITVVTNEAWSNTTILGAALDERTRTTAPREHAHAAATTSRVGDRFHLTILPDGEAAITSSGGTAVPSADTFVESSRKVEAGGQPPLWANVQATVLWLPSGMTAIRVEGDFVMALWDWDLDIAGETYRSGFFRESSISPADVSVASDDYEAEQFLQVRKGTLDLQVPDGRAARAYLASLGLATDGRLAFAGVEGSLPTRDGIQALEGTIVLEGGVSVAARSLRDTLGAEVLGADSLRSDGGVVPLATAADPGAAAAWPWLLGLAGIAPVAAGVWRSIHLARARRLTLLRMDAGRYELALHGSRGLLRSRRHRIFARTVRTVALLRLGRPAEARALLDEKHWRGPLAASRLYLLAHACALEGDREAARRHLEAGLALDRGLRADAATNPTLRPLLDRTPGSREGYT